MKESQWIIGSVLTVIAIFILGKVMNTSMIIRETEKLENSVVFGIEVPKNLPPIKYMIVKGDGSVQWGYLSHKEKP